jgi:hypothetical protein
VRFAGLEYATWMKCATWMARPVEADRVQPDRAQTEQEQRIQVRDAATQSPVQAGRNAGRAAGMPGEKRGDQLTGDDRLPGTYRRADRLVGGPETVGVIDADHSDAGDVSRERDRPGTGRDDLLSGRTGQIHTAMTGKPRPRRRVERCHHGRCPGQRPAKPTDRGRRTGRRRHAGWRYARRRRRR